MPSEHLPAEREPIVTDDDLDAAIALCGGDPRLALRAMFIAYTMLQEQAGRPFPPAMCGGAENARTDGRASA